MSEPTQTNLRILTYNIHKAIGGVDRKYRPERIIDTIRHYDPDIALLQEVDDGVPRSRMDRQVDLLGDALGLKHRAFQANVKLKQGNYGNATLSRFPISESVNLDLTIPLKKRRRALIAEFHIAIGNHHRKLMVCNTHLGLAGLERTAQMKKVLRHDTIAHLHSNTPAIIAGDLNDVWSSLAKRMLPDDFISVSKHVRTFPAFRPLRSLDAIYYRGDLEPETCFAGHTKLARQASDHLPLIADFRINVAN